MWTLFDGDFGQEFVSAMKAAGYDGAIMTEKSPDNSQAAEVWVALDQESVKSAIGNESFEDTPDIRFVLKSRSNPAHKVAATETEAFRRWFGNSKATDDSGAPMMLYHGTNKDITAFSQDAGIGKNFDTGIFLSSSPAVASTYAVGQGANVMPVYASLQNPVFVDAQSANWDQIRQNAKVHLPQITIMAQTNGKPKTLRERNTKVRNLFPGEWDYPDDTASIDDITRWARRHGYDGVIFKNVIDHGPSGAYASDEAKKPSTICVAFHPHQIKSAIANDGSFDPSNPDIRFRRDRIENDSSRISPELLRKWASSVHNSYKGLAEIIVLESLAEAPRQLSNRVLACGLQDDFEAATFDGRIYLHAPNVESLESAQFAVLEHEAAHIGLRAILGDHLEDQMLSIYEKNANIRMGADDLANREGIDIIEAVEEIIADIPSDLLPRTSWWRGLLLSVSRWLRKCGFDLVAQATEKAAAVGLGEDEANTMQIAELVSSARLAAIGRKLDRRAQRIDCEQIARPTFSA